MEQEELMEKYLELEAKHKAQTEEFELYKGREKDLTDKLFKAQETNRDLFERIVQTTTGTPEQPVDNTPLTWQEITDLLN